MSEQIRTIENVDTLFSEIIINGESYKSSKYVEPSKEEIPQEVVTENPSAPDTEGQAQSRASTSTVSAVELNDVVYPIEDENTYDKEQINKLISETGDVKTVDSIEPDEFGNINLGLSDIRNRISTIENVIPEQASEENPLVTKEFVNSSVQTATANFRGEWQNWADVPSNPSLYPEDYAGSRTPTVNDYISIRDASDYGADYEGTWRFKYSGTWATNGKAGWLPEYQINETPLTAEQLATLNSGVTADNYVPVTRTINGKPLNDNIQLTMEDIGGAGVFRIPLTAPTTPQAGDIWLTV